MPRAGQVRPPSGERLSDRIAIGVLTRSYPPELVDQVVAEAGRTQQRTRLLPARVAVYYVLAMALFSGQGYEEVARLLTQGLAWARRWQGSWQVPTTGAITRARRRLGAEPLRALFARVAGPLATSKTVGAWYRGWRLVAVDGTTLDVPDTPANQAAFGRPPASRGTSAFPQVRLVGLAECGTHALLDAELGPYTSGELGLMPTLARSLTPGMLVLADRGLVSFDAWRTMAATGADLLWRTKTNAVLPVVQHLADGSYLSQIVAAGDHRSASDPVTVRVVEYALDDPGRPQAQGTTYRLLTSILDPEAAPAAELAALYHQRWEFETTLDELKTHQHGPAGMVLRSKTPELVAQEVWGMLLVHRAIRELMHQAALTAEIDPDRLSFTRAVRAARRQVTRQAALSPSPAGACGARDDR